MQEKHPKEVVTALVDTPKVHHGIKTSSKRTVQPSSTLTDELSSSFRHIGFTLRCLDIGKMPFKPSLGHQLKAKNTVLCQEHVLFEDIHPFNTLLTKLPGQRVVTMEVLFQRASHNRTVPVRGECTRQHTDISKSTFQRLIQNVGDLIFEVLRSDERVQQFAPSLTQHGMNLSTSATEVTVVVEGFPQRQKGFATGLCSCINQDDNLGVQNPTEPVEEPSVGVDLLAILLFEAEEHLDGGQRVGIISVRSDQLLVGSNGELGGIFELYAC